MMQDTLPRSWKEEFALAAAIRREDIVHREKMAAFDILARKRTEEARNQEKRRDQEFAATVAAFALPQQVMEFRAQLDSYDAKTVEALMDNQEAADSVREKIREMLTQAHVLPDGRCVFKTQDGEKVFDEHGKELGADIIDPAAIDGKKPRWEMFKAANDERVRLSEERQKLHDYQAKLDQARDRLDKGEITEKDLAAMKSDLSSSMPEAVRQKLDRDKPSKDGAQKLETGTSAVPNDVDCLLRQTGLGPSPQAGPG